LRQVYTRPSSCLAFSLLNATNLKELKCNIIFKCQQELQHSLTMRRPTGQWQVSKYLINNTIDSKRSICELVCWITRKASHWKQWCMNRWFVRLVGLRPPRLPERPMTLCRQIADALSVADIVMETMTWRHISKRHVTRFDADIFDRRNDDCDIFTEP
jgi:hypothetical protein